MPGCQKYLNALNPGAGVLKCPYAFLFALTRSYLPSIQGPEFLFALSRSYLPFALNYRHTSSHFFLFSRHLKYPLAYQNTHLMYITSHLC